MLQATAMVAGLGDYREVWCADFEFRGSDGDPPDPICLVAREFHTGRVLKVWRDDLVKLRRAPFDTGPDALMVAYFASAELGCFLSLDWDLPENVLDLYAEHRVATNGLALPCGNGLLGALAIRGLPSMEGAEKEAMRSLVLHQASWSATEAAAILDYCAADTAALARLLECMVSAIDWPRALLRGRYMAAVARMERAGVPVDTDLWQRLAESWTSLKVRLIEAVDADYGVYEGTAFSAHRFAGWLERMRIPWPRYPSGALMLDADTFKQQARLHPVVNPLRELRNTVAKLRLTGLTIGRDGRNRCLLSPFASITGRNQPSNTRFIFGPAAWMRSLIRPPAGYGLAYVDWSAQEIAIAAALSGDDRMALGYANGDPYLAFGKAAGLAPPDATKATHGLIRDRCKAVCLGVNYGMEAAGLAARLGITLAEARELMRLHRGAYPTFWRWSEWVVAGGMLTGRMTSVFGWPVRIMGGVNPQSLQNYPMQSNASEMMRLAAIAATEAGIEVCCPVHDAFLVAAPLERLDADVARMRELMEGAGRLVTGGLTVRTDATVVRWPDRYADERGAAMFSRVMSLLEALLVAA